MKLYEIYTSVQGETQYAGRPTTLVRFTGCDLRCSYCDTEYAFYGGTQVALDDMVKRIEERGIRLVLLTGGEPLLQRDLPELAKRLLSRGYEVMVETGGHRDTSIMPEGVHMIVDVKTPESGEAEKNFWPNLDRLRKTDAVKFVVCSEADYNWARQIIAKFELLGQTEVLLSPSFGQVDPRDLVAWMVRDKLPARLNLQIHKMIWPPETRGV